MPDTLLLLHSPQVPPPGPGNLECSSALAAQASADRMPASPGLVAACSVWLEPQRPSISCSGFLSTTCLSAPSTSEPCSFPMRSSLIQGQRPAQVKSLVAEIHVVFLLVDQRGSTELGASQGRLPLKRYRVTQTDGGHRPCLLPSASRPKPPWALGWASSEVSFTFALPQLQLVSISSKFCPWTKPTFQLGTWHFLCISLCTVLQPAPESFGLKDFVSLRATGQVGEARPAISLWGQYAYATLMVNQTHPAIPSFSKHLRMTAQ